MNKKSKKKWSTKYKNQKQHCNHKPINGKALATFKLKNGVKGYVTFTELINKKVKVEYKFLGLKDGNHGFHIHELGDFKGNCDNAGGHFNPYKHNHGGRNTNKRHIGDLGNIKSINGIAEGYFVDKMISIRNKKTSIIGRSVVVHDLKDDLGKGNTTNSKKTGSAGKRLNCAKINLV